MAVADWRRVLDSLAAVGSVRWDVQQLRALTERMDAEALMEPHIALDRDNEAMKTGTVVFVGESA